MSTDDRLLVTNLFRHRQKSASKKKSRHDKFFFKGWTIIFLTGGGEEEVGMLVNRKVTHKAYNSLYTWVERGTVRVKFLVQQHNTMTLARARTSLPISPLPPSPASLTGGKRWYYQRLRAKLTRSKDKCLTGYATAY